MAKFQLYMPAVPAEYIRFYYESDNLTNCFNITDRNDNQIIFNVRPIGMYTGKATTVLIYVYVLDLSGKGLHSCINIENHAGERLTIIEGSLFSSICLNNAVLKKVVKQQVDANWNRKYQQCFAQRHILPFLLHEKPVKSDCTKVRLGFIAQVAGQYWTNWIITDPIFDKRRCKILAINQIVPNESPVTGGDELLIYCNQLIEPEKAEICFVDSKIGWSRKVKVERTLKKRRCLVVRIPNYNSLEIVKLPAIVKIFIKSGSIQTPSVEFSYKEDSEKKSSECKVLRLISSVVLQETHYVEKSLATLNFDEDDMFEELPDDNTLPSYEDLLAMQIEPVLN